MSFVKLGFRLEQVIAKLMCVPPSRSQTQDSTVVHIAHDWKCESVNESDTVKSPINCGSPIDRGTLIDRGSGSGKIE